jgi:hypothetical protein
MLDTPRHTDYVRAITPFPMRPSRARRPRLRLVTGGAVEPTLLSSREPRGRLGESLCRSGRPDSPLETTAGDW